MSGVKELFFGGEPYFPPPAAPKPEHWLPPEIDPGIVELFEKYALEQIASGETKSSADFILARIRWYERVERRNRDFKCNDHWTSHLARWFMAKYPQHDGFFELRKLRAE